MVVILDAAAPYAVGDLSFQILDDSSQLSFMSFVGHVIYGAVAAWLFETWHAR